MTGCRQALGMENYLIADGQISASSQWDDNYAAIQGRLHFKQPGKSGAWSAKTNDVNQWLQIDLRDMYTKVSRVASQGRDDADQWVTKYKLQYSTDGVNFQYYKDEGQAADKVGKTFNSSMLCYVLRVRWFIFTYRICC